MSNILSNLEAATVLRCDEDDPNMLDLLPLVDAYIEMATGRDWAADTVVRPEAKAAARMLLMRWHEDPGGMAAGTALLAGFTAALTQLEALALELETSGIPDDELKLISTNIAADMAVSASFVLVFSHEMAAAATGLVTLEDSGGSTVATTNTLDVTGKIMTVNPNSDLTSGARYTLVIDYVPDVYGQTYYKEIGVTTA